MISGIGTINTAVAIVGAAIVGRSTFSNWKKQKSLERRMQVAEAVLTFAYRFQTTLNGIREQKVDRLELREAEESLKSQDEYSSMSDSAKTRAQFGQAIITRIYEYREFWNQVFDLRPVARALLGKEVEDRLRSLTTLLNQIRESAKRYAGSVDIDNEPTKKFLEDLSINSGGTMESDRMSAHVQEIVDFLDHALMGVIGRDECKQLRGQ